MIHIDLFSGIGGFSLAFDNIFNETKNTHIFCEIDPFCQEVLRKHWPSASIISNIRDFTNPRGSESGRLSSHEGKKVSKTWISNQPFLLTGGFPCQPFSQAGRRKGTEDDRHLWPEMLRVIRLTKPQWIIAENVRGLLTIGGGLVFEQVCSDLEESGYEVQPIVIPAVAVNAPHRRDRVWFIAHKRSTGLQEKGSEQQTTRLGGKGGINVTDSRQQYGSEGRNERMEKSKTKWTSRKSNTERCGENASYAKSKRVEGRSGSKPPKSKSIGYNKWTGREWNQNWLEVATRLCRMDDGVSRRMDRNPRLKALGNAIVPQVAEEIIKAIKNYANIPCPI